MRASNGYEYPNAASVESHNNCKCQAVQVYGDGKIQGYDPKAYEAEYLDARRAWKNGEVSEELQKRIDAAKERHNEAYINGQASKRWDDTNAILMVWREQRGEQ